MGFVFFDNILTDINSDIEISIAYAGVYAESKLAGMKVERYIVSEGWFYTNDWLAIKEEMAKSGKSLNISSILKHTEEVIDKNWSIIEKLAVKLIIKHRLYDREILKIVNKFGGCLDN